ncbi:MAG TPA: hypothetical protein VF720_16460 [Candidatus Eisenbacteria bacterium]
MAAKLLDTLLQAEVEFVVVGGLAAVLHGSTLLTRDLDICVPIGARSFLKLQSALRPLNPRVRAGSGVIPLELDTESAARLTNLYLRTDDGRLDCLGSVAGLGDYEKVLAASEKLTVHGYPLFVLGLDGLIVAKEAMGRPRDLETVTQLKAIRERLNRH